MLFSAPQPLVSEFWAVDGDSSLILYGRVADDSARIASSARESP
jgi:hypothetical protein